MPCCYPHWSLTIDTTDRYGGISHYNRLTEQKLFALTPNPSPRGRGNPATFPVFSPLGREPGCGLPRILFIGFVSQSGHYNACFRSHPYERYSFYAWLQSHSTIYNVTLPRTLQERFWNGWLVSLDSVKRKANEINSTANSPIVSKPKQQQWKLPPF